MKKFRDMTDQELGLLTAGLMDGGFGRRNLFLAEVGYRLIRSAKAPLTESETSISERIIDSLFEGREAARKARRSRSHIEPEEQPKQQVFCIADYRR